MKVCNFTKTKFAETLFSYLRTAASVIHLYFHKYLHIPPIHFNLNQSKSHRWSQANVIILAMRFRWIITLLLLLCLRCRLETMSADNTNLIKLRPIQLSAHRLIINRLQTHIKNSSNMHLLVKIVREWKPSIIFAERTIFDVWLTSK